MIKEHTNRNFESTFHQDLSETTNLNTSNLWDNLIEFWNSGEISFFTGCTSDNEFFTQNNEIAVSNPNGVFHQIEAIIDELPTQGHLPTPEPEFQVFEATASIDGEPALSYEDYKGIFQYLHQDLDRNHLLSTLNLPSDNNDQLDETNLCEISFQILTGDFDKDDGLDPLLLSNLTNIEDVLRKEFAKRGQNYPNSLNNERLDGVEFAEAIIRASTNESNSNLKEIYNERIWELTSERNKQITHNLIWGDNIDKKERNEILTQYLALSVPVGIGVAHDNLGFAQLDDDTLGLFAAFEQYLGEQVKTMNPAGTDYRWGDASMTYTQFMRQAFMTRLLWEGSIGVIESYSIQEYINAMKVLTSR